MMKECWMVQECWEQKKQLLMGVVGEAQSLERLLVEAGVVVIPALAASELLQLVSRSVNQAPKSLDTNLCTLHMRPLCELWNESKLRDPSLDTTPTHLSVPFWAQLEDHSSSC
jgi:hypothetical protein